MPAARTIRNLTVAAVATALLAVPSSALAKSHHKPTVKATIALGDKRAPRAHAAADCPNVNVMPTADNLAQISAAILCLHNQVRANAGLPALKLNTKLAKAALSHSADMVTQGYFDHSSPSGSTFVDRILGAGYVRKDQGWTLGENLAWGTGDLSTPAGVMNAWMNSAGHKANILKRTYREVGIGIRLGVPTDNSVGATYTLDFGAKS